MIKSEAVLADNMAYMKQFPDKFFSLALCDPEYGIKAGSNTMGRGTASRLKKKAWDNKPASPEYFAEVFRISRNQVIFGGNYFTLPPSRGVMIWGKGPSFRGRSFSEFEYI